MCDFTQCVGLKSPDADCSGGATAFAIATVSVGTREKTSSTIAGAALTVALSLGSVVTHFVRCAGVCSIDG